jgi:energy-coupling factor transporter ATP-binding protein EcfA2
MNKCIKVAIKNCKELEPKELNQILYDIRYKTKLACNKAMTWLYTFTQENMEHKEYTGENINEKTRFGKSHGAWIENRMNEIMDICNSGNVAQTRQFVSNRFQDDKKKGLLKGEFAISNFKKSLPIIIHNKNYKILQSNKGYEVEVGLFNMNYQKENNVKRITFVLDKLDGNGKSTLNKLISKEYKQGSAQIIQDSKGKWYIIFSFGFEPKIETLNQNRILGVDLGITNVATMQVYDSDKQEYERLSWKECFIDG